MTDNSNDNFLEESNLVLDEEFISQKETQNFLKRRKKRRVLYLILFLVFAGLNTFLYDAFRAILSEIFSDTETSQWSIFFFGCAIWGFMLSLIFSIIPVRGSSFKTRYLNVSLLIMFILNAYFTLMGAIIILTSI